MSTYKTISGSGGGKSGGSTRVAQEDPNTLQATQYAKILDLIGEGEIEGLVDGLKSVYLGGVPIQSNSGAYNFSGVTIHERNGSPSQDIIPGFDNAQSIQPVGVEVVQATPITTRLTETNLDKAKVTISIPKLIAQDTTNGDMHGSSFTFKIEVQSNDSGFQPVNLSTTVDNAPAVTIGADSNSEITTLIGQLSTNIDFRIYWKRPLISTSSYYVTVYDSWDGNYANEANWWVEQRLTNIYGGLYIKYKIEYKLNGAPTWTPYITDSITTTSSQSNIQNLYKSINIGGLTSGFYEIRLTVLESESASHLMGMDNFITITPIPDTTITGKCTSQYKKDYSFPLPGIAPWDIRVTRISPDSSSSAVSNSFNFESVTAIVENKFNYPNSAMIAISIDASQFNEVPVRGFDVKLLKVKIPVNYDPINRTYTGLWDGTFKVAWTDNPAWCFYDLLTNERFGLGQYLTESNVDKWQLYSISKYCDELVPNGYGGVEPRLTFNVYLQEAEEAYTVLQNLASAFKGMLYWANNQLSVLYDHPSTATSLFNNANVIDGQFTYSGTSDKARHNVVLVTWNDPLNQYKPKMEYVEDQEDIAIRGIVQKEIHAIGTTSRGQANRLGRWILYAERYETEALSFKCSLDNVGCHPGDIIDVYDKYKAGIRYSGRLSQPSTTTVLTLDSSVSLTQGVNYTVVVLNSNPSTVTLPDGSTKENKLGTLEERTLINVTTGTTTSVELNTALPEAPAANTIWAIYEDTLKPQKFKVLSILEEEKNIYEITAVEHNESKYDYVDNFGDLVFTNHSVSQPLTNSVTNIVAEENLYIVKYTIKNKVTVSWDSLLPVSNAINFEVDYNKDNEGWINIGITSVNSIDILDGIPGSYIFRIRPLTAVQRNAPYQYSNTINILGKTAPPEDVTNFNYRIRTSDIELTWNAVTDLDLYGYELRVGADWDTAVVVVSDLFSTTYIIDNLPIGNNNIHIKAKDTTDHYSTNESSVVINITAPTQPTIISSFAGQNSTLDISSDIGTYPIAGYEIRYGNSNWESATYLTTIDSNIFSEPMTWTSKTYVVKAIDVVGNYSTETSLTINNSIPSNITGLNISIVDNVIKIIWDDVPDTDIKYYTIKQGTDWSTGTLISNIDATSYTLNGYLGASLDIMIKAVDIAGLESVLEASSSLSIVPPSTPILNYSFNGPNLVLDWSSNENSFEISYYELRYDGTTWENSTFISYLDADTYIEKVSWVSKQYRVKAYDTYGNASMEGIITPNIVLPSTTSMLPQVIDNNVLLYWTINTGTLPIDTIELRKGSVFSSATVIGEKSGTFTVVFEPIGAQYTYWIVPIDTAGNYGTELSVTTTVNEPPDYILRNNWVSTFSGTLNNMINSNGKLFAPVNTTETYQQHFDNNIWTSPQDQINAGYDLFIEPTLTTSYYEEVFDQGTILPGTKVTLDISGNIIDGTPTVVPTISVSSDDVSYTDYVGVLEVVATNFRYIKIKIEVLSTGGDVLYSIDNINVRLDVKLKTDAGSGTAVSTDSGGTAVTFNVGFLDVESIVVSPKGSSSVNAVYDFTDTPNPTTFYVYLFDDNGTRVSGDFSWTARGY